MGRPTPHLHNIPISNLTSEVQKLYLEDKLIGGLSIDYAPNTLVSWYNGKEITIFDFNKVCKMDNRFTGYKIFKNKTEIVIQITGL
jgi:hypothetical protein